MSPAAGSKLGPYEILSPLGAGGMGEVYKARDTRLDRTVAIKISKQEFSQRFEREARAIAALNHANICQLYDVGPNYLVMELVDGEPLKGPLPLEKALAVAAQILDALGAAHQKGIVHRDLKPANILATKQGIKLLDFGLAKPVAGLQPADATVTSALTSQGQIIGTLQYMAPEQLQGKEADQRSDIFAFGCVFYEVLTGKRAFDSASAASVIAAIIEREPPAIGNVVPPVLDRILRRCLAKDPEQRWQSARDLRSALDLSATTPMHAEPARPRKLPWVIAAAFALLAAIAFWSPWRQAVPEQQSVHFQLTPPPGAQFVLGAGGGSAISPDGRMIAFVAVSTGGPKLWIRPLDSVAARELPGTDGAFFPFWSPDSRSMGFFAGGKLKRIDLAGGPPTALTDTPSPRGGAWTDDGTILFAARAAGIGLQKVPASGGSPVLVTALDSAAGETSQRWPQSLPGRRLLYFSLNRDPHRTGISLASLDHPSDRAWLVGTTAGASYIPPRGGYPGYLLWYHQESLAASPFDLKTAKLTGEPSHVRGGEAVSFISGNYYGGVSSSNDGDILFATGSEQVRLSWFDRDGKPLGFVGQPDRWASVRISPDATRVVASLSDRLGQRDATVVDFARGVQTRVTSGGAAIMAIWSPDGRRLIYYPINGSSIVLKSATGTGEQETILQTSTTVYPTDWSPDGRYLLYEEDGGGHLNMWLLPRGAGEASERKPVVYLKTPSNQSNGQFSPDGKWIAYTSDESGQEQVYVQSFPATEQRWQVSSAGGNFARWRRDGKELFYRAPDGKLTVVSVRSGGRGLEFGTPVALFRIAEPVGPHTYPYDVTPDGKRILALAAGADNSTTLTVLLNWQAGLKP